jgi:hypothetical protein
MAFVVDDIVTEVQELRSRGVAFEVQDSPASPPSTASPTRAH